MGQILIKAAHMSEPLFFSQLDSPLVSDAAATAVFCDALRASELKMHEPGDIVGGGELKQKLGEGSFGTVWMTADMVAVKIIKPAISSLELMARFDQERATLAMMDHQNIVKTFKSGNLPDGRPFFVMELVSGLPLTEYCAGKSLALVERLQLFLSLCAGVQHAHESLSSILSLCPRSLILVSLWQAPVNHRQTSV
jgi:eukaryotic-like serine/threonine-protein kinase